MREPEIVKASYSGDINLETLRGFPLPHAGLYLLVPLRNEQEGYELIERLKAEHAIEEIA